jgi:DNA-binding CsgD family transcriptional regulator
LNHGRMWRGRHLSEGQWCAFVQYELCDRFMDYGAPSSSYLEIPFIPDGWDEDTRGQALDAGPEVRMKKPRVRVKKPRSRDLSRTMRARGMSVSEIAEERGISRTTVYRHLDEVKIVDPGRTKLCRYLRGRHI